MAGRVRGRALLDGLPGLIVTGTTPQAGTFLVDGLLEGPASAAPDTQAKLANWVAVARKAGFPFSLEMEGDGFSLLGDARARPLPAPGADPSEPLRHLLQQLVDAFPPEARPRLFSTVRSIEYGDDLETQTIYALSPAGAIEPRQRVVDAITAKAPTPLATKDKIRLGLFGLLVLGVLFALSSLFIDWGSQFQALGNKLGPFDGQAVERDAGPFSPYLAIQGLEARGSQLQITLARTDILPKSAAEAEQQMQLGSGGLVQREALRALAAGYLRVQLFAKDGAHLGTTVVYVGELRTKETTEVTVPFRRETPPTVLRLAW